MNSVSIAGSRTVFHPGAAAPHNGLLKAKGFDEDALLTELNVRQDEWEYDCRNCFSTMPAGLFESLCDTIGIPASTLMNVLARLDFEAV